MYRKKMLTSSFLPEWGSICVSCYILIVAHTLRLILIAPGFWLRFVCYSIIITVAYHTINGMITCYRAYIFLAFGHTISIICVYFYCYIGVFNPSIIISCYAPYIHISIVGIQLYVDFQRYITVLDKSFIISRYAAHIKLSIAIYNKDCS